MIASRFFVVGLRPILLPNPAYAVTRLSDIRMQLNSAENITHNSAAAAAYVYK